MAIGYEDYLKYYLQTQEASKKALKQQAEALRNARLAYLGSHRTVYGGGREAQMTAIDKALLESLGKVEAETGLETARIKTLAEQEKKARTSSLLKTIGTIAGGAIPLIAAPFTGGLSLATIPAITAGMGLGSAVGGLAGGIAGIGGAESVPSDIMAGLNALSSTELDKLYKDLLKAQKEALERGANTKVAPIPY